MNANFCFADEQEMEDIDQYFQEPEQTELHGFLEYNQNQEQQGVEEEAIGLDSSVKQKNINFEHPKKFEQKSLFSNSAKVPIFTPIQDKLESASRFSTQEYDIKPVSTSYSRKYGKFKFGTMYDASLDSTRVSHSTAFFTKYEGKHFGFAGGFSKSTTDNYDGFSDKFYIAPELKITRRLSLLDVMKTDVAQINKSNEFVLRYTPNFKRRADEVQFELGAGQSFFNDNYVKSSIRFSTNFKL